MRSKYSPTRPILIYRVILFLILFLGFSIRIYNLSGVPAGFFADEASIGYNAYSILTTGADEFGVRFPVFFRAFGEYKSPIQTYSTVPLIAIFGLNEFAVRMASVIYGLLTIIAIYFLSKQIFKDDKKLYLGALFSALFLTISPWHIHFSRAPLEGLMPFCLFTTLGLFFFLKAQEKPKFLYLSLASFALAMYCYFPARIFIPLFGIGLFMLYFRFFTTHKKIAAIGSLLLIFLLIPFLQNFFSPVGLERWKQVNIFSNPPQGRTITQHITTSYLRHFSFDFLFSKGDIDMPGQFISRHSVRGIGELYLFQFPLIIFGIYSLFKKDKKTLFSLLLWLAIYPVGSVLTVDESPQATRSIIGVIPFQILSAAGVLWLFQIKFKAKKLLHPALSIALAIIIIVSTFNYLSLYFTSYPLYSSGYWGWQYGPREVVSYFVENEKNYDDLYMIGEFNAPYIFFKFYAPHDCQKCKIGLPSDSFVGNRKQLFALTPDYLQKNPQLKFALEKSIYYPNGDIAFQIGLVVQ